MVLFYKAKPIGYILLNAEHLVTRHHRPALVQVAPVANDWPVPSNTLFAFFRKEASTARRHLRRFLHGTDTLTESYQAGDQVRAAAILLH